MDATKKRNTTSSASPVDTRTSTGGWGVDASEGSKFDIPPLTPDSKRVSGPATVLQMPTTSHQPSTTDRTGELGPYHPIWNDYRRSAKVRGLDFTLSKLDFYDLISARCVWCGCHPQPTSLRKKNSTHILANGIDRIDNSSGYVMGNVQTLCSYCNHAKSALHETEFVYWLAQIANHLGPSPLVRKRRRLRAA